MLLPPSDNGLLSIRLNRLNVEDVVRPEIPLTSDLGLAGNLDLLIGVLLLTTIGRLSSAYPTGRLALVFLLNSPLSLDLLSTFPSSAFFISPSFLSVSPSDIGLPIKASFFTDFGVFVFVISSLRRIPPSVAMNFFRLLKLARSSSSSTCCCCCCFFILSCFSSGTTDNFLSLFILRSTAGGTFPLVSRINRLPVVFRFVRGCSCMSSERSKNSFKLLRLLVCSSSSTWSSSLKFNLLRTV